jgi:hypothetical protein
MDVACVRLRNIHLPITVGYIDVALTQCAYVFSPSAAVIAVLALFAGALRHCKADPR